MQTHFAITPCINATAVITRPIRTVHHSGAKRELIHPEREAAGMEGGGQNCKMDKGKKKKNLHNFSEAEHHIKHDAARF